MRILGIDLGAKPGKTGAVELTSTEPGLWKATQLSGRLDDDRLVSAAEDAELIGVDSPLGWPVAFVAAVTAHNRFESWPGSADRTRLTHRDTDRVTRELGKKAPLSVSADKLGSVAMRCALLQRRWGEVWGEAAPRDGSGRLVETYPAAAFAAWEIDCKGYKSREKKREAAVIRQKVMGDLQRAVRPWLQLQGVEEQCIASDHTLDALACALVALASMTSAVHPVAQEHRTAARVEGWIHLPSRPLSELQPPPLSAA